MTTMLEVDARFPDPAAIAQAVAILRGGGLVAFPTETVYGLGGLALDERALARIFLAKGRPTGHPLIAHVDGEEGARAVAASWSDRASRLAKAFWPGPLTLVVPRAALVPASLSGGQDSIAVRAPSHPVALALLRALGEPLAAPSANRYQTLSPTLAAHVAKSLGDKVDLILDGGATPAGIESTVVDVRGDRPLVLRHGAIALSTLRAVDASIAIGNQAVSSGDGASAAGEVEDRDARPSPGMDVRHYAPRALLRLAVDTPAAERLAREARDGGAKVGLVVRGGAANDALNRAILVRALPDDPKGFEARLFATLHALDDEGCDVVVVVDAPDAEAWLAVKDRLARAKTQA